MKSQGKYCEFSFWMWDTSHFRSIVSSIHLNRFCDFKNRPKKNWLFKMLQHIYFLTRKIQSTTEMQISCWFDIDLPLRKSETKSSGRHLIIKSGLKNCAKSGNPYSASRSNSRLSLRLWTVHSILVYVTLYPSWEQLAYFISIILTRNS